MTLQLLLNTNPEEQKGHKSWMGRVTSKEIRNHKLQPLGLLTEVSFVYIHSGKQRSQAAFSCIIFTPDSIGFYSF